MSAFSVRRRLGPALAAAACLLAGAPASAQIPSFSGFVVIGDSLSDDGNVANVTQNRVAIRYPGQNFNYADGRFTNNRSTSPASARWSGVWHEQLATFFANTSLASNSLDNNGTCFAFGGATTRDGQQNRTVISNPTPFGGGQVSITIDNMGQQVTNYLARGTPNANALFLVWGGANDLFDDFSDANVSATANRVAALVTRLAQAGARSFLVPNLPPLGNIPHYNNGNASAAPLNTASAAYRDRLSAALDTAVAGLAGQGITARVYRLDIYTLFQNLVANPLYFGFTNTQGSAQGNTSVAADQFVFWDDLHPTAAAHYQIAAAAARVLAGKQVTSATLGNISSRAQIGTGAEVAIGGFVVTGTSTKRVLIRGIGPSLSAVGVNGTLQNPSLIVYNSQGAAVNGNDDWQVSTQTAEITATGLAPTDPRESAVIVTLQPGAYTAVLSGAGGGTGVGLVEAYDLDTATAGIARAINLSTRARVASGDGVLIGGFVVSGTQSKRVIVRALGPDLAAANVPNLLADPTLTIFNAQGQAVATNDNWRDTQQAEIQATGLAPGDVRDAAIVATLPVGTYTAVVRGAGGTTGTAIVEIYDLD